MSKGGLPAEDMAQSLDRLESLARLSREASTEGRQELLREVTDMFLGSPPGALSEAEMDHFGKIMEKLAFEMEMKVRKHLAESLSDVDAAPHELLTRLASDEVEVARPVLMKSGLLRDSDLMEIIRQCSQEHLLAVTMREQVSEQVSDALVEKGNDEVLGSLAGNAGAELSSTAIETMVERSEGGNENLQEALVTRGDLPEALMRKMYRHVSSALREHIVSQGVEISDSEIDQMLAEAQDWLKSGDGEDNLTPAEKFIERKQALKQLNPDLLVKLLREGKIQEFTAGIAKLTKIDLATARQAILDESGEKLAVICKSLDIDSNTFSQVVDLMDSEHKRDEGDKKILVGVYGRITAESAQRAMRFLRTRQKMQKGAGSKMEWQG